MFLVLVVITLVHKLSVINLKSAECSSEEISDDSDKEFLPESSKSDLLSSFTGQS